MTLVKSYIVKWCDNRVSKAGRYVHTDRQTDRQTHAHTHTHTHTENRGIIVQYANLGRARKSPQISENSGKASNPFNFGNSSKVFSRCFYDLLKFSGNLRKSSEVFGNFRKTSETVQK